MFTMHIHLRLLSTLVKRHKRNSAVLSEKVALSPCLFFPLKHCPGSMLAQERATVQSGRPHKAVWFHHSLDLGWAIVHPFSLPFASWPPPLMVSLSLQDSDGRNGSQMVKVAHGKQVTSVWFLLCIYPAGIISDLRKVGKTTLSKLIVIW